MMLFTATSQVDAGGAHLIGYFSKVLSVKTLDVTAAVYNAGGGARCQPTTI